MADKLIKFNEDYIYDSMNQILWKKNIEVSASMNEDLLSSEDLDIKKNEVQNHHLMDWNEAKIIPSNQEGFRLPTIKELENLSHSNNETIFKELLSNDILNGSLEPIFFWSTDFYDEDPDNKRWVYNLAYGGKKEVKDISDKCYVRYVIDPIPKKIGNAIENFNRVMINDPKDLKSLIGNKLIQESETFNPINGSTLKIPQ